jgi:hypothetical protein
MTHDIRRWITLLCESESILDREALGTIIQVQPESDFGATTWYMKFADGTWRPILNFVHHTQPNALYRGDDPVDPQALLSALAAKRVGRPVEGLHPGDRITASVQMHALPDGAIIVNPQTGSVYHKKDGHFFSKDGKDLPADVFRSDNAQWKE